MRYIWHSHRFADIIINSDYALRKEIEEVIGRISLDDLVRRYDDANRARVELGKKTFKGKQAILNQLFGEEFTKIGWESEKSVFESRDNDLIIDFWKRGVGVDVAFNHRSFIGGDLLRLQAAGEVTNIINAGVYVCGTKAFTKFLSSADGSSMVHYERAKWFLEKFYAVLTVPIWLIGLEGV